MQKLTDFNRLCIHSITNKPLPVEIMTDLYAAEGVRGITIWRDALEGRNIGRMGKMIRDKGIDIVSLCRGGFFPALTSVERDKAVNENIKIIDEAAELGAPLIVLVSGSAWGQPLDLSRLQILKALEKIVPYAEKAGIKLGIEPLHPMYADTRCAINTLKHANDIAEMFNSSCLGVVVDVFHVWWDPDLETEIARSGKNKNLMAFHVCDWKQNMEHMLNDRGLMGEGCIPLKQIREWVENTGFDGFIEVEIFSNRYWSFEQHKYLRMIKEAYLKFC